MPAPRPLPDVPELRRLRSRGWTLQDIAGEYGTTPEAVWRSLERIGFATAAPTYRDVLPWRIAAEHVHTAVMRHFRALARVQAGRTLDEASRQNLERWLDGLERDRVVVNYHPEAPANAASRKGGFYYVTRLPSDAWIIREPVRS